MFFTDGEHFPSNRVTSFSTPFFVWKIFDS